LTVLTISNGKGITTPKLWNMSDPAVSLERK